MTKIDIISGFLGAGKTTLIKKLLEDGLKGEKLVLIENEFGEIGIDGGFLKDTGIEITEMNSGCICCSLVGDFSTALKEVLDKYTPDRIIIEPSGVGKLSDVIQAVLSIKDKTDIVINSLVTVADATKCKMYMKNFGEFFNNQIEHANTIILSRTQKMKDIKLENTVKDIREHNQKAAIITTSWDEINGKQMINVMEQKKSLEEEMLQEIQICPECGHDHHHHDDTCCSHDSHSHHHNHTCCNHDSHDQHHAEEVFTSWGIETPHKFTEEEIEKILKNLSETELYGTILRAKGMLPIQDGTWRYFDLVPREYEIREGTADYTGRICVIGTKLAESSLKELFKVL